MDAAGDLLRIATLGDEAIGPGLKAAQDVEGLGLAGADHHRDAAEVRVRLDPFAEVEAAVPGEQEIAEHEIESVIGEVLEAALGVGGDRHFEVRILEDQGELLGLGGAVFDDEHARHGWLLPTQEMPPPPSAAKY